MVERKFGLGVFVCVFDKSFSKILLVKRNEQKRKKYGMDWGNVGGKVELGEKLIDACVREVREEIGLELSAGKIKLIKFKEYPFFTETEHTIHFIYATVISLTEKTITNDESEGCEWFDLNSLPTKMFESKEELKQIAISAKELFKREKS